MERFFNYYINIHPLIRGVIKKIYYDLFRQKIQLGIKARIKSSTDWLLFPGCTFSAGKNLIVGRNSFIKASSGACIFFGDNVGIGDHCHIVSHKSISIDDETILAPNVKIFDHNHAFSFDEGVKHREYQDGIVKIGKRCWIGANCIILMDVTIGNNCVIGAGSVVTKSIPDGSIAVGVPARIIKKQIMNND